nr:probable membrane-associated kinase regulator 6 [Ipomoea batatas]
MDPTLPHSQIFFGVSLSDFSNFDFSVSESSLTVLHADELISNGFFVPLFAQSIKSDSFDRTFDLPEKPTKQDQPICVKLQRFGFAYGRRNSKVGEMKGYEFSSMVSTRIRRAAYSVDNWLKSTAPHDGTESQPFDLEAEPLLHIVVLKDILLRLLVVSVDDGEVNRTPVSSIENRGGADMKEYHGVPGMGQRRNILGSLNLWSAFFVPTTSTSATILTFMFLSLHMGGNPSGRGPSRIGDCNSGD